jgi:hypothetical protein
MEMELKKLKKRPEPLRRSQAYTATRSQGEMKPFTTDQSTSSVPSAIHRRRFKPNPMLPPAKSYSVEPPKVIDYLADRRLEREKGDKSLFGKKSGTSWMSALAND